MKKNFFQSVVNFVSNVFSARKTERQFTHCYEPCVKSFLDWKGLAYIETGDLIYVTTTEALHADIAFFESTQAKKASELVKDAPKKKVVKSAKKADKKPVATEQKTEPVKEDSKKAALAETQRIKDAALNKVENKKPIKNTPKNVDEKKADKIAHVVGDTSTLLQVFSESADGKMGWHSADKREDDSRKYRIVHFVWKEVNGKVTKKVDFFEYDEKNSSAKKDSKYADKNGSNNAPKSNTTQPEQKKDKVAPKTEEQKPEVTINAESKTADIVSAIADKLTGMAHKTANIKARKQTIGKTNYCFCYITLEDGKVKVYGEHNGVVKDFILCQPRFSKEFAFHVYSTLTETKNEQTGSKDKKGSKKDAAKEIEKAQNEVSKKKNELKKVVASSDEKVLVASESKMLSEEVVSAMKKTAANIAKTMTSTSMKAVQLDIEFGMSVIKAISHRDSGLTLTINKNGEEKFFNLDRLIEKAHVDVMNPELIKTIQRIVNECVGSKKSTRKTA